MIVNKNLSKGRMSKESQAGFIKPKEESVAQTFSKDATADVSTTAPATSKDSTLGSKRFCASLFFNDDAQPGLPDDTPRDSAQQPLALGSVPSKLYSDSPQHFFDPNAPVGTSQQSSHGLLTPQPPHPHPPEGEIINPHEQPQYPNKYAMLKVLMKTLVHEKIEESDIEKFHKIDTEILRSIVKRKYKICILQKDLEDRNTLLTILNKLDEEQRTEKRSEENNKLMFKRAIKYLINTFKKTRWNEMRDLRKKQYETMICKEFFQNIPLPEDTAVASSVVQAEQQLKSAEPRLSQTTNTDTVSPKTGNKLIGKRSSKNPSAAEDEKLRKFVINPNTINAKYIKFVFRSEAFKSFFEDFVYNHFANDYKKNRGSKILKIIDTVYSMFPLVGSAPEDLDKAKEYIEKNPKFKLPWTDKELQMCIESTTQFIRRVFKSRQDFKKPDVKKVSS